MDILKKRPPTFPLERVERTDIEDLCLKLAVDYSTATGPLREGARRVAEGFAGAESFRQILFKVFYRVGLVGLKLETFQRALWIDEGGQDV